MEQYSIAQARDRLPAIVHAVERGGPVELTRRGRAVAVVLSLEDYHRLAPAQRRTLEDVIEEWRASVDVEALNFGDADFEGVRDRSPGREFEWPE